MRKCIAVLMRSLRSLEHLLEHNRRINMNLEDKKATDVLVFHDGCLERDQETLITSQTPNLQVKLIKVSGSGHAFRREKEDVEIRVAEWFCREERHASSFWFVDFWWFLRDYDLVLRIDVDSGIDFSCDWVFNELSSGVVLMVSHLEPEIPENAVMGLNAHTIHFLHQQKRNHLLPKPEPRHPVRGLCTNVMGLHLRILRRDRLLHKYIQEIDKSNRIYSHRWEDSALWGESAHYILPKRSVRVDKRLVFDVI